MKSFVGPPCEPIRGILAVSRWLVEQVHWGLSIAMTAVKMRHYRGNLIDTLLPTYRNNEEKLQEVSEKAQKVLEE